MSAWDLLVIAAGFIGGAANVIAGGGSFLTLPALMAAGLPIASANGTNRLAILVQAVIATRKFKESGHLDRRLFWQLLPALVVGAAIGAYAATVMDPTSLRWLIGLLFLLMGGVNLIREQLQKPHPESETQKRKGSRITDSLWLRFLCIFAIGLYAGFLQAGATLWLVIAAVEFYRVDHLKANAVKLPLVLVFTLPALVLFIVADQVEWYRGFLLCLGTVFGTHYGVKWSLKGGANLIKKAVQIVMLMTGAFLLLQSYSLSG